MLPTYQTVGGMTPGQYQLSGGINTGSPDAFGVTAPPPAVGNMPPPLPTSFGGGSTGGGTTGGTPAPAPTPVSTTTSAPTPTPASTTTPAPTASPAAALDYNAAFDNFKNFIGYDFALKQAMDAVNHQYAASGQLQSGAAAKAIADYAANIAQQGAAFPYLNYLSGQQSMGAQAASSIAGVGSNFGNTAANINGQMGGAIQNGANATSNGAILGGYANGQMWNNIGSALGNLGSSIVSQPTSGYTGIGVSDRRLKTNIVKIGEDADGLGRYEWNWKAAPNGERVRGVIADEVERLRPWAFVPNFVGEYAGVNYAALEAQIV